MSPARKRIKRHRTLHGGTYLRQQARVTLSSADIALLCAGLYVRQAVFLMQDVSQRVQFV